MKIAIFSDCYLDLTGGIVTVINAEKAALEKAGHTVYVFSSSYPKSQKSQAALARSNIFPVPSCKIFGRGLTPIARRPRVIEKWLMRTHPEIKDFDIYYIHYEAGCSIAGLRLAKKFKIPSVQVRHGREDIGVASLVPFGLRTFVASALNFFHSLYLPHKVKVRRDSSLAPTIAAAKMWTLMVNHANFADLVITPSAHFRKKLNSYGVTREIKVVPNPIADALFPATASVKTLDPGKPLEIIWHSRVSGEKRTLVFLEALTLVRGRYHLNVYGSGPDLKKAEHFAKKHALNVTFHGFATQAQIYRALAKSHLDVLVSYNYDTFGMTLIEAEASGVPVLIADPDMKEIVPPGSFVLSKNPSPAAIAAAIQSIIDSPDEVQKMSEVMLSHRNEVRASHRVKELEKIFRDAS